MLRCVVWGRRVAAAPLCSVRNFCQANQSVEPLDDGSPVVFTNPPRGTRDFYPEDMRKREWLFSQWRAASTRFGFQQYDAPVVEHEQLYTRKAGEDISNQLYTFKDKSNRKLALRPEMTPSLARMVIAKPAVLATQASGGLLKWWSVAQCWRYERMSKGRRREHYQWNVDVWGSGSVDAEAELVATMVSFFESVGLTSKDIVIRINSRALIGEVMQQLGVSDALFVPVCVLVDKLDKLPEAEVRAEMGELGVSQDVQNKLLEIMKCTDISSVAKLLHTSQPTESTNSPNSQGIRDVYELFEALEAYGCKDWVEFSPSVVRGLAYYTGIVFEAFHRSGKFRAIAGGGRYDNITSLLVTEAEAPRFNKAPLPAVGFGLGDAVISEILTEQGLFPSCTETAVDAIVFAMLPSLQAHAVQVATQLRALGWGVDLILGTTRTAKDCTPAQNSLPKVKNVFKHADQRNAGFVVVVGEDEWAGNKRCVTVKCLKSRQQKLIHVDVVGNEMIKWKEEVKATLGSQ